jgi:hypothetical protein
MDLVPRMVEPKPKNILDEDDGSYGGDWKLTG